MKNKAKNGKRFLTFEEYLSMLLPISLDDNENVSPLGVITSGSDDEFYVVQTSKGRFRLMPGPEFSPRLYRGQWKHFPSCKASLFRKCNTYADAVYWTTKRIELWSLLVFHPAYKDVRNWDFDGLLFDFNLEAIAQHYQYPTRILDLSRSKDIAMFFATHKFSEEFENPIPAIGSTAVLYTVDAAKLFKAYSPNNVIIPIGFDPLPRPAAQKAFGLELNEGQDFGQLEGVHTETFTVTNELASLCAKRIGGVSSLLPSDPFEECINLLREKRTISKTAIENSIKAECFPVEYSAADIESILIKGGYQISVETIESPPSSIIKDSAQQWEIRKKAFFNKIICRRGADSI